MNTVHRRIADLERALAATALAATARILLAECPRCDAGLMSRGPIGSRETEPCDLCMPIRSLLFSVREGGHPTAVVTGTVVCLSDCGTVIRLDGSVFEIEFPPDLDCGAVGQRVEVSIHAVEDADAV